MMTLESCTQAPFGVRSTGITTAPVWRLMVVSRVYMFTGWSVKAMPLCSR